MGRPVHLVARFRVPGLTEQFGRLQLSLSSPRSIQGRVLRREIAYRKKIDSTRSASVSRTVIYILLVIAIVAFAAYWFSSPYLPHGIESKGEEQSPIVAYLSLATSVVSLLTAMFGLAKEWVDRKKDA